MENIKSQKIIKISRSKFKISIIVIVLLLILGGVIFFVLSNFKKGTYGINSNDVNNTSTAIPSIPNKTDSTKERTVYMQDYYSYQNDTSDITDTREFLKTSYNAEIKTRNVKSIVRDVKNIIKDKNGRVDRLSENPKNGYISFVIPKINFENFKDDIESITHEKLITENISSENLLNQKQSIEQQQTSAETELTRLQQQKKDLSVRHNQTINTFQNELNVLKKQYESYTLMLPPPGGFDQKTIAFIQELSNQIQTKKQQITSENSNYNINSQNITNSIDTINNQIANINKQDTNFSNNIETVNGYISISWISFWQLSKIFSPIHPTIIIIILLIVVWYILKRTRFLPKIELT